MILFNIIDSFAVIVSAIAAIYAAKGVNEQKKMRILESCPFLIISKVEAFQLCEEDGFPIGIYFINAGKGFAQIRVIDLNDSKIKANIGTPISIPPGDTSYLKLWLSSQKEQEVKLSLYYWDSEGNGYRTEAQLFVSLIHLATGGCYADWRMNRENIKSYNAKLKMPKELLQWPRNELFSKAWWD